MDSLHAVILAGGKGERFWPLSTPENPKPFLRFFSERSLLQQTFDRASRVAALDRIRLVVGAQHAKLVAEQLPELPSSQVLLEPIGRDTSAAIGYASMSLPADATMLLMPADHLIPDWEAFARSIQSAYAFVDKNPEALITFGIKPDRPETNYGYIEARRHKAAGSESVYPIGRFVEKPDRARADKFLAAAGYFWNSGIFLWRNARIRECLKAYLPELASGLEKLAQSNFKDVEKIYPALPKISIDYGVMEKADQVYVVPAEFAWDDVGTWNSLFRVLPVTSEKNLSMGNHISLDTKSSLVYAESQMIATAGIENLIIVQFGNKTLICTREYADRLKELLSKIDS